MPVTLRTLPAAAALVLASTALLTACSGSVSVGTEAKAVPADQLEESLASRITGEGADTIEVICEDDLPAKVEASVDCAGTDADGNTTGIRPVVTSVDGDDVEYDAPLFLPADEVTTQVRASLEAEGYTLASLDCDEAAGEVGSVSSCRVQVEGADPQELVISIDEADGLRFKLGIEPAS